MESYTDPSSITHGSSYQIMSSAALTAASSAFSRSDFKIIGWSCGGSTYGLESTIAGVTGNLSIYALWSEGYKLYFYSTSTLTNPIRFDSDQTGTILTYTDATHTVHAPYNTDTALANRIVYAVSDLGSYIKRLNKCTFGECTYLKSVSFPACTYISNYAFSSCTALTSVSMPVAKYAESGIFYNCTSLSEISLPAL